MQNHHRHLLLQSQI